MKRTTTILAIGLLLGGVTSASAQYPERPGADVYRPSAGPGDVPWRYPDQRFDYRIRVQRRVMPEAYQVVIDTGDRGADAVQMMVQGNGLLISANRSLQNQQRGGRGGYRFSRFSSTFNQLIRFPRDADMSRMRRSQEGGIITLTIPRLHIGYRRPGGWR